MPGTAFFTRSTEYYIGIHSNTGHPGPHLYSLGVLYYSKLINNASERRLLFEVGFLIVRIVGGAFCTNFSMIVT